MYTHPVLDWSVADSFACECRLEQYESAEVKGASAGLVEQSKNLLMHNWRGFAVSS